MPQNSQYTRCPQCQTAFKVTEQMLAMAHGKVRCGACLEVFLATDHLLQPRAQAAAKVNQTQPSQVEQAPAIDNKSIEQAEQSEPSLGDIDASDADLADLKLNLQTQPEQQEALDFEPVDAEPVDAEPESNESDRLEQQETDWQVPQENSADSEPEHSLEDLAHIPSHETSQEDDGLSALATASMDSTETTTAEDSSEQLYESFEAALDDLEMSASPADKLGAIDEVVVEQVETKEVLQQAEDEHEVDSIESHEPELDIDAMLDQVEMSLDDSLSDPTDEAKNPKPKPPAPSANSDSDSDLDINIDSSVASEEQQDSQPELQPEPQSESSELDESENKSGPAPTASKDQSDDIAELDLAAEPEDLAKLADNLSEQINDSEIEPDPLDEFEGIVSTKKTTLRSLMIASVMIIGLGWGSYSFWQNRQSLAWDETWGSATQSLCELLPCDIQPRKDVANIKLLQRLVTPSETNENLLDVKILMSNQAEFEQPFPNILIKFSNSQGALVAQKSFSPQDYFQQRADQLMPINSEVHISFNIELPHPDALGFEIHFE
ncbi:DUF3426 domain-containing protein [Aliikangiella sp. IMCC44653]